jgi:hypothetical protein
MQGYFFSRPLPAAALESWLAEYRPEGAEPRRLQRTG